MVWTVKNKADRVIRRMTGKNMAKNTRRMLVSWTQLRPMIVQTIPQTPPSIGPKTGMTARIKGALP
jgi:hypothetical protein